MPSGDDFEPDVMGMGLGAELTRTRAERNELRKQRDALIRRSVEVEQRLEEVEAELAKTKQRAADERRALLAFLRYLARAGRGEPIADSGEAFDTLIDCVEREEHWSCRMDAKLGPECWCGEASVVQSGLCHEHRVKLEEAEGRT